MPAPSGLRTKEARNCSTFLITLLIREVGDLPSIAIKVEAYGPAVVANDEVISISELEAKRSNHLIGDAVVIESNVSRHSNNS